MNNILTDDKTGQQYMLSPSSQELERGIIQYIPELHAHLWNYIMADGQLYSIHPDLPWNSPCVVAYPIVNNIKIFVMNLHRNM